MKSPTQPPRTVVQWLYATAIMIGAMAIIGAITRLTESGLSITEWAPITGVIPPLSADDWQKAFDLYRATPQYQLVMKGMSMDEFKNIFFWEWVHRLWGRLIGLVYALPLIYFTLTKKIPRPFLLRCWLILLLGAAQGFVGWFMVQSGLVDATTVSPYRLALHLSLALVLLGAVLWTAWDISHNAAAHEKLSFCMKRHGVVALAFLAITIVWGAFVAGMDAGKMYNTWPLMEGEFLPAVAISANPWWKNFFANAVAIQFAHRWLGILTGVMILSWAVRLYAQAPRGRNKKYAINLALLAIIQPLLGILTLLHAVPVWLGTLHQGVAAVLLSYLLFQLHPVSRMHKI